MKKGLSLLLLSCSLHILHAADDAPKKPNKLKEGQSGVVRIKPKKPAQSKQDEETTAVTAKIGNMNIDDPDERTGSLNRTRLMKAAYNGDKDEALNLIQRGADMHLEEKNGFTALELAAYKGHTEIAQLLLMFGDKQKLLARRYPKGNHSILYFARRGKDSRTIAYLNDEYDRTIVGQTIPRAYMTAQILPVVCKLISEEQESINTAQYRFTHGVPARAMTQAKQERNVDISLVVDKDYKKDYCVAINHLLKHGIPVWYAAKASNNTNTNYFNMHHKFYLFGMNGPHQRPLLLSGSCNNTGQAYSTNWEDATLIDDPESIATFSERFASLCKASKKIGYPCVSAKDKTNSNSHYTKQTNKIRTQDFN